MKKSEKVIATVVTGFYLVVMSIGVAMEIGIWFYR